MLTIKSTLVTPDRPKLPLREKLLAERTLGALQEISPLVFSKDGGVIKRKLKSPSKTPNSKRVKAVTTISKESVVSFPRYILLFHSILGPLFV